MSVQRGFGLLHYAKDVFGQVEGGRLSDLCRGSIYSVQKKEVVCEAALKQLKAKEKDKKTTTT